METEAQGGDQEGAPHAAQVTVPAPMFQGLPVPDGGVRGERSCSQGQTRAMAAGLRQPHPCAGPWLGCPHAQEGRPGQRVSTGWLWSLPGLAWWPPSRSRGGSQVTQHCSTGLDQGASLVQGLGHFRMREFYSCRGGWRGRRGPGALGASGSHALLFPAAVGACVCEEREDEQRAAGRPGRGCCPGPGRGEKLAGGAGTVGWSLGSPLRPSVLSEAPGERREQGGSGGGGGGGSLTRSPQQGWPGPWA